MYKKLITELREEAEWAKANEWETPIMLSDHLTQAADAIDELSKRVAFVMDCIYSAEDALDRGTDNEWAREALEKAQRPLPEPPKEKICTASTNTNA